MAELHAAKTKCSKTQKLKILSEVVCGTTKRCHIVYKIRIKYNVNVLSLINIFV